MEAIIRNLLTLRRPIEGELLIMRTTYGSNPVNGEIRKRISQLDGLVKLIDGWLLLLSRDEAFVIKMHLIDGIEWARVIKEFCSAYGPEFERTSRTLRKYQTHGIRKIARIVKRHGLPDVPEGIIPTTICDECSNLPFVKNNK